MLRNYLTVAIRNATRQATFSAINVIGLAVGIGCCLLIYLFVQDEMQYDRFHANADRTYRILWNARLGDIDLTYR